MIIHKTMYCCHCNGPRMCSKDGVNHILHLVLTLFTGWWLLIWLLLILGDNETYMCGTCGHDII